MDQTSKIKCPTCKAVQEEDIQDLAMDTGEMDGHFPHTCEKCGSNFTVEYKFEPFIKTY